MRAKTAVCRGRNARLCAQSQCAVADTEVPGSERERRRIASSWKRAADVRLVH